MCVQACIFCTNVQWGILGLAVASQNLEQAVKTHACAIVTLCHLHVLTKKAISGGGKAKCKVTPVSLGRCSRSLKIKLNNIAQNLWALQIHSVCKDYSAAIDRGAMTHMHSDLQANVCKTGEIKGTRIIFLHGICQYSRP